MKINKIQFKNIKSFGNRLEEISLSDTGELILLTGKNGAGKSTIQEVIDLTIFGQIRGKNTKKIPLKYIPNRFNKTLFTKINFNNFNNDVIEIERKLNPVEFKISKDNIDITKQFKNYTEEEKEKLLDFNYLTFKSFISLSMNDFLNFISLSNDQKKLLLNKLFNLEKLDQYYNITKELKNQKLKELNHKKSIIDNNKQTLIEYKELVSNIQMFEKQNIVDKKKKLKEEYTLKLNKFNNLKIELNNLNTQISDIDLQIVLLENKNENLDSENIQRRSELNSLNEKIKLYDNDKCPYCESDLDKNKEVIIKVLLENKTNLLEIINKNVSMINYNKTIIFDYNKEKNIYLKDKRIKSDEKIILSTELNNIKEEVLNLKNTNETLSLKEIKEKGKCLIDKNKELNQELLNINNEIINYTSLLDIFDENGIRKNIIENVIIPINNNLKEFIDKINFEYNVELNSNFDAIVYERYNEVYNEICSNGEQKIINILIALSYLKFILKIRDINILFLDEIFQSIHEENIDLILLLLKDISKEFNINIFVVHHGMNQVNLNHFDKIIKLNKTIFSEMNIIEK